MGWRRQLENAVLDAVGINIDENPVTPEKVLEEFKIEISVV